LGGIEIQLEEFKVHSLAATPLPIAPDSALEKQIDWRHISLREPSNYLIFAVQTTFEHAMREFWRKNHFIELHSPKLMGTFSESGAECFKVGYFDNRTAYLAQSPQFYKQMAIASGFDRVFEIGPAFRAEPSFTSRHETEFTSVDMEIGWIDSHRDVMRLEEKWLAHALQAVKDEHGAKIKEHFGIEITVPTTPFPELPLLQARKILKEGGHEIMHKSDLDPEGERQICAYIRKKFGHEFVWIIDYPHEVRAFYHMRHADNPELTKGFDLLWNGLEVTTGAQREHRYEQLVKQATERGFDLGPIQDYLNFFKYGCPPHGGAGIGLARLLMVMLGRESIRETTLISRTPTRLTP
jgi:aspartyl-tRNA synthetase